MVKQETLVEKGYTKAESGNVFKFVQDNDSVEGIYTGYEESRLYPGSYALSLKRGAELVTVFVSRIVIDLLDKNSIKPGQSIMVRYLGKKKSASSNMEYNDYEVFYKK